MNWKDISSYSQSDKVKTPKTFDLRCAGLRIIVTRHIHHSPDVWLLQCAPFVSDFEISTGTAEEAQAMAVEYVRKNLEKAIAALTPNVQGKGRCAALYRAASSDRRARP